MHLILAPPNRQSLHLASNTHTQLYYFTIRPSDRKLTGNKKGAYDIEAAEYDENYYSDDFESYEDDFESDDEEEDHLAGETGAPK